MLNATDIPQRTVLWLDAMEQKYKFRIVQGNLVLETEEGEILTRLNKQKVFALFSVGNVTMTSVMLDYCQKNAIAVVLMGRNFRPIMFNSNSAEANYLLRQRQYQMRHNLEQSLAIAQRLIHNKIHNQIYNLQKIRVKTQLQKSAILSIQDWAQNITQTQTIEQLMGIEGNSAKVYFKAYFEDNDWRGRQPRVRLDPLNTVLDMGYTYLFNYIECFVRLFGFDPYIGVLHQTWYKRKSLICDLVEPFRAAIDQQVRKSFNYDQFQTKHFQYAKQQYNLNPKYIKLYSSTLFEQLITHKQTAFLYVRDYYRNFMRGNEVQHYPFFDLSHLNFMPTPPSVDQGEEFEDIPF